MEQTNKKSLWMQLVKAIMTTDTYPKSFDKNVKVKMIYLKYMELLRALGMIYPNMGTMLVYIFIEAKV